MNLKESAKSLLASPGVYFIEDKDIKTKGFEKNIKGGSEMVNIPCIILR